MFLLNGARDVEWLGGFKQMMWGIWILLECIAAVIQHVIKAVIPGELVRKIIIHCSFLNKLSEVIQNSISS